MIVGFDGGRVVTVFPEGTFAHFSLVVVLRSASGNQLHALRNDVGGAVFHQKVNVIAGYGAVEHAEPKALPGLEEPVKVMLPIAGEFEEKSFLMAAVRNVPDMAAQEVTVGAGYRFLLQNVRPSRSHPAKFLNHPYLTALFREIDALG